MMGTTKAHSLATLATFSSVSFTQNGWCLMVRDEAVHFIQHHPGKLAKIMTPLATNSAKTAAAEMGIEAFARIPF